MRVLVAPSSADVAWRPVVGWTSSSVDERTVVHEVGPGVSSPRRLSARSSCEPAICCHTAGGHGVREVQDLPSGLRAVEPCWVPAIAITSVTLFLRLGQYVRAIRGNSPP